MTATTGLVIQGGDDKDNLTVEIDRSQNATTNVYNVIYGGGGDDQLSGLTTDFAPYASRYGMQLFGDDGNDTLWSTKGKDTLSGGSGDDEIYYEGGHDVVDGGDGRDVLSIGADTTLTASKLSITGIEEIDLKSGSITVNDLDLSHFVLRNKAANAESSELTFMHQASVEGWDFKGGDWHLTGSRADDLFDVSSSSAGLTINAGNGDDTIQGSDRSDKLFGELGNDIIFGGDGNDWIWEQHGTNTLHGGDGDDRINADQQVSGLVTGDAGNDTISLVGEKSLIVDGGEGNDRFEFSGRPGNLFIRGGDGRDTIFMANGGDLSDTEITGVEVLKMRMYSEDTLTIGASTLAQIQSVRGDVFTIDLSSGGGVQWHSRGQPREYLAMNGSDQNDHLNMSVSRSTWSIDGKEGNDRIIGGSGNNLLQGGSGDDALSGNGRFDQLNGSAGNDTLREYGSKATLHGGADNDIVYGTGAKVYLFGDAGDDTLVAAGGLNDMHGGDGKDTFVFSDDTGGAIVEDFSKQGQDMIDFSHVSTIKNFQDLVSHHIKTVDGVQAVFIIFGNSEIAINHVDTADLQASSFHF